MATIAPTVVNVEGDDNSRLWTWNLTTAVTDGVAIQYPQFTDLCWQSVAGTQGGAVCALQGSNDGTTWFPLTNAAGGAAATFSADGGKQTLERPRYVRPSLTTAGAAAVIAITLLARRNRTSVR